MNNLFSKQTSPVLKNSCLLVAAITSLTMFVFVPASGAASKLAAGNVAARQVVLLHNDGRHAK